MIRRGLAKLLIEKMRPWYLRLFYFRFFPSRKPVYFSSCWDFPEFSGPLPAKAKDLAVVMFSMNDWHTRMQRTQHLAVDLARRGYPVIYVNPHLGREFLDIYGHGLGERLLEIGPGLLELHVHLPREPVFHHGLLTNDESRRIAEAVTNALRHVGVSRAVQLIAFPIWLDAAKAIRATHRAPLIYDCHDYLPGFSNVAEEIISEEPALFRASDLILCSSQALLSRVAANTPARSVLLKNAAGPEFFAVTPCRQEQIVIGYVGALDSWFDTDAVREAAETRPTWRFELIGRVENAEISALSALPNVELAGEIAFCELPSRLARFSAAVIPFCLNALIEATDPIKAYEYLACGLPVVASEMPELKRFGDLISFYSSPADFVAKLDGVTEANTPDLARRRRAAVETETWEARGAALVEMMERLTVQNMS